MSRQEEVTQITVAGTIVGVIGLKTVLEEASRQGLAPDQATAHWLLERIKRANYVAPGYEEEYERALLKAYRMDRGEAVEEGRRKGLHVQVLGPGCPACERLTQMVRNVMAAADLRGDLEHVRDINEIARYGPLATPALVINGAVKASGRLPLERQILEWLREGDTP